MKLKNLMLSLYFLGLLQSQVAPFLEPYTQNMENYQIEPYLITAFENQNLNISDKGYNLLINNNMITIFDIELPETRKIKLHLELNNVEPNTVIFIIDNESDSYYGPYQINFKYLEETHELITNWMNLKNFRIECSQPNVLKTGKPSIKLNKIEPYNITNIQNQYNAIYYNRSLNTNNPKILVTGFWPPTNEMIRHFSQSIELNQQGWQGGNWLNSGYDIVSFFPTFSDPDCNSCGQGMGDLEVDYQDTSNDFWSIVNEVKPLAIITFSRGYIDYSWEVEQNFYNRTNWYPDYTNPVLPTPNPPDNSEASFFLRNSTLPMEDIVATINNANIDLDSYIDYNGDPGHFVSEFMGYHGVWYRDINVYSENSCLLSGHVHVGGLIDTETARIAAEHTIQVVINHLNDFSYTPGDVNNDSIIDILDIVSIVNMVLDNMDYEEIQFLAADLNQDQIINIQDIIQLINIILN